MAEPAMDMLTRSRNATQLRMKSQKISSQRTLVERISLVAGKFILGSGRRAARASDLRWMRAQQFGDFCADDRVFAGFEHEGIHGQARFGAFQHDRRRAFTQDAGGFTRREFYSS